MDWLVSIMGLPEKFLSSNTGGGVIQDTASSAALSALLAGRERATNYISNKKGCDGKLVAYISTQTHSSLEKAAMMSGIGSANLRAIEVDHTMLRVRDSGNHVVKCDGSNRCGGGNLPAPQYLAACGRSHVWYGNALP